MSRRAVFLLPALVFVACGGNDDGGSSTPVVDSAVTPGIETGGDAAPSDASDSSVADTNGADTNDATDDTSVPAGCLDATGSGSTALDSLTDGADVAKVTKSGTACARTYVLSTTAKLRDSLPSSPRSIVEQAGAPFVRTHNDLFDALYAMALAEAKEDSVEAIQDGAFNDGKPIACPTGGCFETGRKWTYVWTRDVSYSVHLALGALDPLRAKNSLEFKLSPLRTGGGVQVVQDTGSGGSYPVSTDRVVWALGAREVLAALSGAERDTFRDKAFEAIKNTIEHDRKVVWDAADGLYRGEQSFLDWREQTYPSWTASDVVHLGMSKALSTNLLHLAAIDLAASLATEKGDSAAAAKYAGWRDALRGQIDAKFWLDGEKQLSTFKTTYLDPAPVRRFDALGTALAVLLSATTDAHQAEAIASYPLLAKGVPVIWPQQKDTPIYHNRAIWPFVTAYFAKAAAKVKNDAAVDNSVDSLIRGAALNLSNMENFEMVSGAPWVDDGAASGPVVNSHRQLWSVAGYLSMVQDVVFGRRTTADGKLEIAPTVTRKMRRTLFANADSIALNDLSWRGKKLSIALKLPAKSDGGGIYAVGSLLLNGKAHGATFTDAELGSTNVVEVTLVEAGAAPAASAKLVTATTDYKNLFAPKSPRVTSVVASGANLQVTWDPNGETASEITFDVYRDGARVASDLSGSTTSWTDLATVAGTSHCYAVEATFVGSKNHGQHSSPYCYWGPSNNRITTYKAQGTTSMFYANAGTIVGDYGTWFYKDWGDPGHEIVVKSFVPSTTGTYLVQVEAGNGAGPINTGITCGVKLVEVREGTTVLGSGRLIMPHQGAWSVWKDSSFVPVKLTGGKLYEIVIKHDESAVNMSFFDHFGQYTGGLGGKGGAFSRVNVGAVKVLGLGP